MVSPFESPLLSLPAVLCVFVGLCAPLGLLALYSLWRTRDGHLLIGDWTLSNYATFFTDAIYWRTLLRSFALVAIAALVTVSLTFPFAYFVALRVRPHRRLAWILIAILPFCSSYLIRVYAWLNLFGDEGILNAALLRLHLIDAPLAIFGYGRVALLITFVYLFFPLTFIMTYVAVERIDHNLLDSASDLGARPLQVLTRVILPLSRTGLLAAFAFCFILMMGDYITPTLVGGTTETLFSTFIQTKFGFSLEWGFGSSLALILLVSMLGFVMIIRRSLGRPSTVGELTRVFAPRQSRFLLGYSVLFIMLLYAPIFLLVLLAFNSSELIGFPIDGFTVKWFLQAIHNPVLLDALYTSLTVAAWAVVISLVIGTVAAVQLARTRGRWRSISIVVLALPALLPPIMVGLGMIISMHALSIRRALWTVIIAHILLVLPIVVFSVLVRLEGLEPNGELAAMDLGARPWQAFVWIVIPQVLPAIISAGLIGFALSMDEFIVTFLVTGTQVTLPLFIYSSLRYSVTPELNAMSSMMLAFSILLILAAGLVLRGWESIRYRWRRMGADEMAQDLP